MHPFIRDFIPPFIFRFKSGITHPSKRMKNIPRRYRPFNYLPRNLDVQWIMDIGANDGSVTKSGLLSFSNSKIICFEPVSETFNRLMQTLSSFPDRVTLHQLAVSDYEGESEIYITTFSPANSLITQSQTYEHYNPSVQSLGKQKVKVIKLDNFIQKLPSRHFDIVKIDVEGSELSVLKGGKKFFNECVDVIIIEISFQREFDSKKQSVFEIFDFLHSLGYRLINIFDVYNMTYDQEDVWDDTMITQIDCVFRKISHSPGVSRGR
jgi:FkbM family methyltransferase